MTRNIQNETRTERRRERSPAVNIDRLNLVGLS